MHRLSEHTTINISDSHEDSEPGKDITEHAEGSAHSDSSGQSIVCGCVYKRDIYHVGACFLLVLIALGITGIYILYQGE